MIQRKQTLWLLLAGLINSGVFFFDLYRGHLSVNGADTIATLRVGPNLPLMLVAIVMTALPLIAIAMFSVRKRQRAMTAMSIFASIMFITMTMWQVTSFKTENAGLTGDSYWIGTILPFISIVFLIMALIGIRKDEKLVKSLDRLR